MNEKIQKVLMQPKIQKALDSEHVIFEGWDVSLRSRGNDLLGTRTALLATQTQAESVAEILRKGDEYPSAKAVYVRVSVHTQPTTHNEYRRY